MCCTLRCACLCSSHPGTHLGYLRALDSLDSGKCDQILAVHRLRDERLHNVSEMFAAEMQQVDDEYKVRRTDQQLAVTAARSVMDERTDVERCDVCVRWIRTLRMSCETR